MPLSCSKVFNESLYPTKRMTNTSLLVLKHPPHLSFSGLILLWFLTHTQPDPNWTPERSLCVSSSGHTLCINYSSPITACFQVAPVVKNLPTRQTQEVQVWSLVREDPLEEEINGNPLQYSCLERPLDRGAWRATVHGVTQSWTQLSSAQTRESLLTPVQFILLGLP